jgi:arylsulfatase A-like enzyme
VKLSPLISTVVLSCVAILTLSAASPVPRPPNVIVILTDDQGYHDVGFNGCEDIPTPHLDSIARNGVKFTNGYVTYSVCSPSRAGLLTGRYQQRFGHERNPRWEPRNPRSGLPLTERTLADVLGQVGYRNGIIGKWHLGAHPDLHPQRRGFHEFFGMLGGGHRYFPEEFTLTDPLQAKNEADTYRLKIERDGKPVETKQYLTDEFSDEAVRFVTRHKDQPFFLYLAYNAPHAPLQAPEKYLQRFAAIKNPRRRTYAAMVSAVDDGVGRLLATLRELKLEEHTLIFFLSDNGGPTADNASNNSPLRGAKGSPWEGGWRVPFAMQWPGHLPAGRTYDAPVSSLDIFATAAALAAAPTDPARPLDGVNLVPFLTGQKSGAPHETIFLRMHDKGAFAVRRGDLKLVIPDGKTPAQLYDLATDIREAKNLAAAQPDALRDLDARLKAWNAQLIPPVFDGLMSEKRPAAGTKAKAAATDEQPD